MAKATKALQKAKYVYLFGNGKADGNGSMKALLGGKGANLAEMSRIGLPVPPGFTITTDVCTMAWTFTAVPHSEGMLYLRR
jgi:pyruvate,orthophosphate dikinase